MATARSFPKIPYFHKVMRMNIPDSHLGNFKNLEGFFNSLFGLSTGGVIAEYPSTTVHTKIYPCNHWLQGETESENIPPKLTPLLLVMQLPVQSVTVLF